MPAGESPDGGLTTLRAVIAAHLPPEGLVVLPPSAPTGDLTHERHRVLAQPVHRVAPGSADAVVLADDELSRAGNQAETLVADAAAALRPKGILAVTARNELFALATGTSLGGMRGFTSESLARLLRHPGFRMLLLAAPGAAARLGGAPGGSQGGPSPPLEPEGPVDLALDRRPGLLDAAPRLLAVAMAPGSPQERSREFFDSLPRKVVAAAVLCQDDGGRVLIVHDRFKREWTIPGGVVDADEDPRSGAEREAHEETGMRIATGALLGVFSASWPDRVSLVYAGVPYDPAAVPGPLHPHEIDAVEWADLDEALRRLAPHIAWQVRHCIETPGGTWRQ